MSGAVACARDPAPEQRAESAPSGSKIFVLNGHGAPTHNIALSEAADFVSETFRVTMLHVTALLPDKALAGEAALDTALQKWLAQRRRR